MDEKVAAERPQKGVTWQLEQRLKRKASAEVRNRENLSRRDQPTWYNCRMLRDSGSANSKEHKSHTKPRVMSAPANSCTSSRSIVTSLWNGGETSGVLDERWERGRELLRRRARLQLRKILPTKFEKFDASDLARNAEKLKIKKLRCTSAPLISTSYSGNATIAVAPKSGDPYFINGVTSSAYRRPSVQLNRRESDEISTVESISSRRRYSEPVVRFAMDERSLSIRRRSDAQFSAVSFPRAASTSAPATLASNDVTVKSKATKERPPYLEHDWRSEILSRYATEQPWVPRIKTTRYFPKFANLQDVNCRNPYLIPNGLLYNAT